LSLTLRAKDGPRVFDNVVIRRTFGAKTVKVIGNGEFFVLRCLMMYDVYQKLWHVASQSCMACMACMACMSTEEAYRGFSEKTYVKETAQGNM
jgi:hypothetical protein